jgi:negative regulator of flagellin synthesis FlgM
MKVELNGSALDPVSQTQDQGKTGQASQTPNISSDQDTATLSTASAIVSQLTNEALAAPEVRQNKVDALRQAIQNGEYQVDPGTIADAMIKESE